MTVLSPSELMRAYYRSLDEPDPSKLDDLFTPDAEWRFPGASLRGGAMVRRSMERSLATGLRMSHQISRMVEQGDTALCELEATNIVHGQTFLVRGAVVCEAQGGRITRLVAYPDAIEMNAFLDGLRSGAKPRS